MQVQRERALAADPVKQSRAQRAATRRALDQQQLRECVICHEVKSWSEFHRRGQGLQSSCGVCQATYDSEHLVAARRRRFTSHLKRKYGLTLDQWSAILISQSGLCAICDVQMVEPATDHDHQTHEVRGLLCLTCNTRLHDGPVEWYAQAAQYLTR